MRFLSGDEISDVVTFIEDKDLNRFLPIKFLI